MATTRTGYRPIVDAHGGSRDALDLDPALVAQRRDRRPETRERLEGERAVFFTP
jgi:hypothetical protein